MSTKSAELKQRIRSNKAARHALVLAENRNAISFELRAMLDERDWTQSELARRANIPQPVISKYLGGYDSYSLSTLRRLGEALDVALLVTYVPFSEFIDRLDAKSYVDLAVPPADRDALLQSDASTVADTCVTLPVNLGTTLVPHQSILLGDAPDAKVVRIDDYRPGSHGLLGKNPLTQEIAHA